MKTFLVRKVLYPLHELVMRRPTLAYLSQFEKSQWLPPEALKTLQWKKLKRLLHHAYERVPYYRSLFRSLDLHPQDVNNEADFRQLPFLTKELIRGNSPSLIAEGFQGKLIRYSTGGSTGEPLIFYTDSTKESAHNAAKLRARRWWGIEVGDRQIDLWGSPIELSKQDWLRVIKDRFLMNFILLSAFNLTEITIERYLQTMRSFQPMILYGYATVLYRVAQFCEEKGIDPGLKSLKAIVATSEMLFDYQREKIAKVFQRPVVNEYGSRDGGYTAQECPSGNMHIAMEHVYVEFVPLNDKDPEKAMEVVITNLDSYGMPFIRYRVGDLASGQGGICPCGRGLMLMQSLQGRSNDMLISPTGKVLHGLSVIYILREIPGMKQFKVTQKAADWLAIEVVKNSRFQATAERVIRDRISQIMEAPIRIDIIYRREIPPERSGKYRWIVSKMVGKV